MLRRMLFFLTFWFCCAGFVQIDGVAVAGDRNEAWVSKIVSIQGRVVVQRLGESKYQQVRLNDIFFAGDQVWVGHNSRAGFVLCNDALVRLNQDTHLVFTEIERPSTYILKLIKGAADFFSHRPRSLKIFTPFVNGVVQGTEFFVEVGSEKTRIDLFQGRILAENANGSVLLEKGQGVVASAGTAPQRRILVHPQDSVQWALYYPSVLSLAPEGWAGIDETIFDLVRDGRIDEAIDHLGSTAPQDQDERYFLLRAGLLLHVGRVVEARSDIGRALAMAPEDGDAMALLAIIDIVQNRPTIALSTARAAVRLSPGSAATKIALSYALQAAFQLHAALDIAMEAVEQAPENSIAWARLADLRLSFGNLDQGVAAAKEAIRRDPYNGNAHSLLGFAHLTRIETDEARKAFNTAIHIDSSAPLPRLGLGLATIRDGDLAQGRKEIEIAAGLDPHNSLIRSYLGKAYFDEKRGPKDGEQFEIAKELDPNDPTPWFYDAIRKQSLNRPVEALLDLQKSIELNDNRAIYRSRLLLDQDLAARSANLGRIYSDLGFEQMALVQGWKAVNTNYGEHAGHRFLSDTYVRLRRHEIARSSELLQAKLLQPVNVNPLQSQQNETNLLILQGTGPSRMAFNEFNPLFVSDGHTFQASGVVGNNETFGDELTLSGIYRNFSYALGQFHHQTEGFRENNDLTHDIYNVFAQVSLPKRHGIQAEYRYRDTDRGDVRMLFGPDRFAPDKRTEETKKSLRLGGNVCMGPRDHLIVSLIGSDAAERLSDRFEVSRIENPSYEDQLIATDANAFSGEVQWIHQSTKTAIIAGMGAFHMDQIRIDSSSAVTMNPSLPDDISTTSARYDRNTYHANAYLYANTTIVRGLVGVVGAAYDAINNYVVDDEWFRLKSGLLWSPLDFLSLRAAWFQNVKRPFAVAETLEPTQVAGFNQFFDDIDGSQVTRYGVAADVQILDTLFGGIELSWRDLDIPNYDTSSEATVYEDQEEKLHRAYLNWIPWGNLSVSGEAFVEKFEYITVTPKRLTTYRFPITLAYYFDCGIFSKIVGTHVNQKLDDAGETQKDRFWVADITLGYRLPKRLGTVTFSAKNLFDKRFSFQDVNFNTSEPLSPLYVPDRLIIAQVALSF